MAGKKTICCLLIVSILTFTVTAAFAETSTNNNGLRECVSVQYNNNGEYVLAQPSLKSLFFNNSQEAYLVDSNIQLYSLPQNNELLLKVSENQFLEVEKATLNSLADLSAAQSAYGLHQELVDDLENIMKIENSNENRSVELYTPGSINTYAKAGETKYQIQIAKTEDTSSFQNVQTGAQALGAILGSAVVSVAVCKRLNTYTTDVFLQSFVASALLAFPALVYIPSPGNYLQVAKKETKNRKYVSIQEEGHSYYTPRAIADQGTVCWMLHAKLQSERNGFIYKDKTTPSKAYTHPNYDSTKLLAKAREYEGGIDGAMFKEITYGFKYDDGLNFFASI